MTMTLSGTSGIVLPTAAAPAFSAYQSSAQSLTSSVWTKVNLQSEEFDTNGNFDSTTNYRFTPTVAGYYQIEGCVGTTTLTTLRGVAIYKNGAAFKYGTVSTTASSSDGAVISALIYFNGSTDYVEFYTYQTGTTPTLSASSAVTYFQGVMVRSA